MVLYATMLFAMGAWTVSFTLLARFKPGDSIESDVIATSLLTGGATAMVTAAGVFGQ